MIDKFIVMYQKGAITGYQAMLECLHAIDPGRPDAVLAGLPGEILDEMLAYARRYDPHRRPCGPRPMPAEDQIRAAERWISDRQVGSARSADL